MFQTDENTLILPFLPTVVIGGGREWSYRIDIISSPFHVWYIWAEKSKHMY